MNFFSYWVARSAQPN